VRIHKSNSVDNIQKSLKNAEIFVDNPVRNVHKSVHTMLYS